MDEDFSQFIEDFNREVKSRADSNDYEVEEAFTEYFGGILVEYGEIDDYQPASWLDKNIGARVDAYHFDDDMETVHLVINLWKDWNGDDISDGRLTNSEIDATAKRAINFLNRALSGKLPAERIDEGHPAYDLAQTISDAKDDLIKARIIIVSDGKSPPREGITYDECLIETSLVVCDMQRVFNRQKAGEREGITIDFNDYGGPVPCVPQKSENGYYTAYLSFVSGEMLANLYEHHKTRLLEMNVRVFLSQRVKVNQGIRDTIRNDPSMFGAYSNGITVYADDISTVILDDGSLALSVVQDFQIVNGGQTTASLYHTRKTYKSDLSDTFVQMKVMVIHESAKPKSMDEASRLSDILVPKIGRYSNTQNKIQMSDLHANDPPHPELHAISLQVPAPDPTGGTKETYWFYEKSRGSWDENKRLKGKTVAQRRHYEAQYPRSQRFDKGEFSKVWYSFHEKPHIVSLGPQKCFAEFNTNLLKEEFKIAKETPGYWPGYFKRTIGLLVIWKALDKRINQRIREGMYHGFKQNRLAYTLALLASETKGKLDLNFFWEKQSVPEPIMDYLLCLSDIVHDHIDALPSGVSLVPEWCKKEDCWKSLKAKKIYCRPPPEIKQITQLNRKGAKPKKSEGDQVIEWCKAKGGPAWMALSSFLKERDLMGGKQRSQAFNMGRSIENKRTPSDKLSIPCKKIWEDASTMYDWSPDAKAK